MAMGGRREGAGRKGYYDELMVKKIMASANNIIFNTLEGKGKYADVSLEIKIEIAARFALKAIPQAVNVESTEKRETEIIYRLEGLDAQALRNLSESCRSRALPQGTS